MGWRGRVVAPGYPQHVIHRGNNRQDIFFADGDFERYLAWLGDAARRHDCAIHAYVLMTNHIHLLVTPSGADDMARMMQSVGRRYSGDVNARYGRTGTLWEGRYRSCVVDSDRYLFTCARYIELNPVRAGLVRHPAGYRWSSYHHNAERADPTRWSHRTRSIGISARDEIVAPRPTAPCSRPRSMPRRSATCGPPRTGAGRSETTGFVRGSVACPGALLRRDRAVARRARKNRIRVVLCEKNDSDTIFLIFLANGPSGCCGSRTTTT